MSSNPRMNVRRDIRRRQRAWATARRLPVDRRGFLYAASENLYLPFSPAFSSAMVSAGGGELKEQRDRPAKIRALCSSAVLAINVFQYWEHQSGPELPMALGLDGSLEKLQIEQSFHSGLPGEPPTLDVVLRLSNRRTVAIESKFTEWMTAKRLGLRRFAKKYLEHDPGLWAGVGLAKCQQLAIDIAAGRLQFRQLDALQLLKHALGLQRNLGAQFSLHYLYCDYTGHSAIAARHRAEIARFADLVDHTIGFRAVSYQQLFAALDRMSGVDSGYLDYLRQRYFCDDDQQRMA